MKDSLSTDLRLWRVKVEVVQKFDIEVSATSKGEALEKAIDLTDHEPPVDTYVSEAHAEERP